MPFVSQGPIPFSGVAPSVPTRLMETVTPDVAENIINNAQQLGSDDEKYQAAVELARIDLQDKEKVSDDEFKKVLDSYYEQFDPEKSAREMRGENAWTDAVGGARNAISAFNEGIGNALDFAGDTLIGGAMDLAGAKNSAEDFRNLVTGEDLAIIPDVLTDVALTATGVGIPAVIAKNAIQLSPQMAQGISGRDALTLEQMAPEQQAANFALGFGGTALSAIPGVGKGVNIGKNITDDAAKAALKNANNDAAKAASALQEAEQSVPSLNAGMAEALERFIGPAPTGKELKAMAQAERKAAVEDVAAKKTAKEEADAAVEHAKEFSEMGKMARARDIIGKDATGFGKALLNIPGTMKDTHKRLSGLADARKLAKEANKKSATSQRDPKDIFKSIIESEAAVKGKSVDEFAKDLGLKTRLDGSIELPVKETRAARKEARKAVKDSRKSDSGPTLSMDEALEIATAGNKIRPGGLKGRSPLKSFRTYLNDINSNILTLSNRGAPAGIDDKVFDEAFRTLLGGAHPLDDMAEAGAKAAAGRMKKAALKGPGSRMANVAGGLASGAALLPLAEQAQSGGSLADATASIFDRLSSGEVTPAAFLPMMLTGSKTLAKNTMPGLRGKTGASSVPHNALRSVGSAERWNALANGEGTENNGIDELLRSIKAGSKEDEKEE